ALIEASGLKGVDLADGDSRVPISTQVALWQLIAKGVDDPYFGLRSGVCFTAREAGLLGYVMVYSATLGGALQRLTRYSWVLNDAVQCALERGRHSVAITDRSPEHGLGLRYAVDYRFGAMLSVCRQITGAEITPIEVAFAYEQRGNTLEHQRFFGCPLRFGQPISKIVFREQDLELPLQHSDATLVGYLSQHAEQILRSLTTGSSTKERVRSAIWNMLTDGKPTLARVASELRMPARTLQRRLAGEGTSVQQEVEEIRRAMATAMFRDPAHSTDEVAYLLGYAEPSTLFRSFRRWTGMTPQEYRKTAA
ncbi:MAG TPA: AraC family transcriptional regulator, partial [Gemmatimonadaceae bacterium]|nr:AraC family transcriptional regulator [Gemmatimonadaceae bacterium]